MFGCRDTIGATLLLGLVGNANVAGAAPCNIARPVVIAGLDYDSASFSTAVATSILAKGYGCKVEVRRGTVLPLIRDLVDGKVDIIMEVWSSNPTDAWIEGERNGKVLRAGTNYSNALQGWYVPSYVVDGSDARARGLGTVTDLLRFKSIFTDRGEPNKGRFYNCPAGWQCEIANTKKLRGYGLERDFVNFRPANGPALDDAIEGAVRARVPILFYYWEPTWLLNKYKMSMLNEPPFNDESWRRMLSSEGPATATAYPIADVFIAANAEFAEQAPAIVEFLKRWRSTTGIVNDAITYMHDRRASAEEAAHRFMSSQVPIWSRWVSSDVADRIRKDQ
jgi:glycine betaine/proline transport system substrate-binding protein